MKSTAMFLAAAAEYLLHHLPKETPAAPEATVDAPVRRPRNIQLKMTKQDKKRLKRARTQSRVAGAKHDA